MIDGLGQLLAEAREQFLARQASLRHQAVDLVGAQGAGEIAGRNLLVRAVCDPRTGGLAMATLLQLLEQVAEPARDHAAGGAACEQATPFNPDNCAKTRPHALPEAPN